MANKVYPNAAASLEGLLFDGMTIMAGGFGLCGIPENLIAAVRASGVRNLTVISNNAGVDGFGLGVLLNSRQVKKMISSYVGENKEFERQFLSGELELEFNPQGTLAERCRTGGAGIPAFYTKTGVGTVVADGKELREFGGETYVMETALKADVSIVKAWKGDAQGNLVFRRTARNFNPDMATAGKICIAEVEELVPVGSLDPDHIHLPGIFVQRISEAAFEKRIEQRTVRPRDQAAASAAGTAGTAAALAPSAEKLKAAELKASEELEEPEELEDHEDHEDQEDQEEHEDEGREVDGDLVQEAQDIGSSFFEHALKVVGEKLPGLTRREQAEFALKLSEQFGEVFESLLD